MKKLITAADVEKMHAAGENIVYVDKNTIITAAAVDFMKENGMMQTNQQLCAATPTSNVEPVANVNEDCSNLPANDLMKAIKTILSGHINNLNKPEGRFQIINTRDARYNIYDTGVTGNNVQYQELVGENQSAHIRQGIVKLIGSAFPRTTKRTETGMVLEGSINVSINGIAHVAKAGDMIFIPANAEIILEAEEYAKLLYTTYLA